MLIAISTTACGTRPAVSDFCVRVPKPVYLEDPSIAAMTRAEKEQIVAINEQWEANCK
jgi:hypothetical protein